MIYKAKVFVDKEKMQKVNSLLALDDLRDMSNEELAKNGAKVDDTIHLFSAVFENDFRIDVDVYSGNMHYYDVYVLRNSCGYEVEIYDSKYVIEDKLVFTHVYDTYEIEVEREAEW